MEGGEIKGMSITPAAAPRPDRPDYHLWCMKDDFSNIFVCHKCGLQIKCNGVKYEVPAYGCPGKQIERQKVMEKKYHEK